MRNAINELRKGEKVTSQSSEDNYQSLEKYAINLNEAARSGKLDPVIGRDEEIRRVLQILSRRAKNNPILIGEPGTGKTAIRRRIGTSYPPGRRTRKPEKQTGLLSRYGSIGCRSKI